VLPVICPQKPLLPRPAFIVNARDAIYTSLRDIHAGNGAAIKERPTV